MKEVLRTLPKQARSVGVASRLLLLVRGFYSVEVVRHLRAARQSFLMPAVIRGRKPDDPRSPSGTRVFAAMKRSGWFEYTMRNAEQRTAMARVRVSCRH